MQILNKSNRTFKRILFSLILSVTLIITAGTGVSVAAASSRIESNKQTIYNYLAKAGYNNAAICGIMANMYQESGFEPTNAASISGYTDESYTAAVDNGSYKSFSTDGVSYGLVQLTSSGHKSGLLSLAKQKGTSIGDLNTQLEFLVYELKTNKAGTYLRSVSNDAQGAYDAGYYFCYYYEMPAGKDSASVSRGNLAKNTYWPVYGNASVSSTSGSSSSSSSGSSYSTGTYQVTADSLYVRSGADKTYSSLGVVKKGAQYNVTSVSNTKWGKISYQGKTGYISLAYCKKVSSSGSSSSSSESSSGGASYKVTASTLSIRSGRGVSYTLLTEIPKGKVVTVSDIKDGWGKTTYNNKTGYICIKYAQQVTSSGSSNSGTWKVTGADYMNVRSGADKTYTIIGCVSKGYTFTAISISSNNWAKISYKGKTGWISLKYCTKQ